MSAFSVDVASVGDLRREVVAWLRRMAEMEHSSRSMGKTKRHEMLCDARSDAYENAARFWEEINLREPYMAQAHAPAARVL